MSWRAAHLADVDSAPMNIGKVGKDVSQSIRMRMFMSSSTLVAKDLLGTDHDLTYAVLAGLLKFLSTVGRLRRRLG